MLEREVQRSGAGQRGPAPRRALAGIRSEELEVICQRGGGGQEQSGMLGTESSRQRLG